jgi:adenosylcobinamide-GDP ribazoletransferase
MGILLALQFLTRIPIPLKREFPPEAWARSMAWFPLVGALLGLLLAGANWALGHWFPPGILAALILSLWVALSGALHLDGFVDCCDALAVALPPTRRLEILKDVHTGTYGVVGVVLLLLLAWLAIGSVSWQGLVLAPVLGRWTMVLVTFAFPYARPSGLGKGFKESLTVRELAIASLIALACAVILGLWHGIIVALVAVGVALLLAKWAAHQLGGGITGDVYGMVCEVVQVVTLLAWGALRG